MTKNITEGFKKVDASDGTFLIQFLADANRIQSVMDSFRDQLGMLDIREGNNVLDIGCGIGERVAQMAEFVGAAGKVVGTDLSETMVNASEQRYGESGLPIEFHVAEACSQPFADQSFDRIRMERVLMYVSDILAAFTEFRRLLKDGGRLLVMDLTWDSLVVGHKDVSLTRRITQYACDSFPRGRIGADLYRTFKESGFHDIAIKPVGYFAPLEFTRRVLGGILATGVDDRTFSIEETEGWWSALEDDDRAGHFFVSFQGFIVAGTKGAIHGS